MLQLIGLKLMILNYTKSNQIGLEVCSLGRCLCVWFGGGDLGCVWFGNGDLGCVWFGAGVVWEVCGFGGVYILGGVVWAPLDGAA